MGRPQEHTYRFYAKETFEYLEPVLMQKLTIQGCHLCKAAGVCLELLANRCKIDEFAVQN